MKNKLNRNILHIIIRRKLGLIPNAVYFKVSFIVFLLVSSSSALAFPKYASSSYYHGRCSSSKVHYCNCFGFPLVSKSKLNRTFLYSSNVAEQTTEKLENVSKPQYLFSFMPVITASFMITANTVGAGTMVLPSVAEEPGFLPTCGIFAGKCSS